ncbi:hypothetical protein Syun_016599 [Stephania yunnanensis]|uniref:ABC transporter B family member 29, chloroplastic n=1 Tax=Stephania yunnanensis TaxID=152371 RepID=A0AAP0J7R9_9MAGN
MNMAKTKTISPTAQLIFFKSKPKPTNFILQYHQIHIRSPPLRLHNLKISSCSIHSTIPSNPSNRNPRNPKSHHSPLLLPSLHPIKPFVQSQWPQILGGWLCSAISVYCLSKIVPKVGTFSAFLVQIDANRLSIEGLVLGVLFCVRLIANYLQQAFLWSAALRSAYQIRVYVFEKVLERDLGFFERGDGVCSGDVAYRITAEGSDVADTVHALLNTIVPCTMQLVVVGTQMLLISPALSLISALIIPPTCLIIAYLGERLRNISKKAHICVAKLSAHLNEILPSMLLVKANNAELCEGVRFRRLALADLSENLKKKKMKALIPQIIKMIYAGAVLTFCAGSLIIWRGSSNGSNIVSFVTSLFLLIEPIQMREKESGWNPYAFLRLNERIMQDVGKAYNELKQGEPAIDRLFDLTLFSSQIIEEPNAVHPVSVTGDVKFHDISFGYGQNMPLVLDGLNLHIKSGETIALIGPSGGGKTTITKLLLRLYDPLRGSVLIDDVNIRNIQLKSLRKHVGLVSQDVALLSGTVAENIGYQDLIRGIDFVRAEHAAKTANVHEFIKALPRGYDTDIGQRGTILSGGQKQRQEYIELPPILSSFVASVHNDCIAQSVELEYMLVPLWKLEGLIISFHRLAIARAIYQNPSILILDEATSALDSKSELLVRQALERLMRNRTVLVVAHRIETILMADRIVILENGKLEEVTRSSLLNRSNCYSLLPSD